jgi:hypothetical protein
MADDVLPKIGGGHKRSSGRHPHEFQLLEPRSIDEFVNWPRSSR